MHRRGIAKKRRQKRKPAPQKDSIADRSEGEQPLPLIQGKYARSLAMALEIPMSPIAGGVFGHYIDMYFNTEPWFTGILAFAGFIHSVVTVIRIAREIPPTSQG